MKLLYDKEKDAIMLENEGKVIHYTEGAVSNGYDVLGYFMEIPEDKAEFTETDIDRLSGLELDRIEEGFQDMAEDFAFNAGKEAAKEQAEYARGLVPFGRVVREY